MGLDRQVGWLWCGGGCPFLWLDLSYIYIDIISLLGDLPGPEESTPALKGQHPVARTPPYILGSGVWGGMWRRGRGYSSSLLHLGFVDIQDIIQTLR